MNYEDPKWELVYPELALAHDEEFDLHAYIDEKASHLTVVAEEDLLQESLRNLTACSKRQKLMLNC